MKPQATATKFFALAGFGFVLTLITVVMGAPFLRVLYKAYKPVYYWAVGVTGVVVFALLKAPAFIALVGAVWLLIGLYSAMEKRGLGWKTAGFVSLLLSASALLGGFIYSLWSYDINTWDRYVLFVKEMFDKLVRINPTIKFDAEIVAQQTPSVIVLSLIIILGIALIFERKAAGLLKVSNEKIASQLRLREFRLPDVVIWVFLLAFLVSMVNFGIQILSVIGMNLVNIGVILFLFQGLAVLEVLFIATKASTFFRVLTYIIMVSHLSVILSGLGLIDYWVDFRSRLRRLKTAEIN